MEEILLRPQEELKKLNLLLERRARLESACQRVSVRYGTERVRGGRVDREEMLVALAGYETAIQKQRAKLAAAEKTANTLLKRFADASSVRTAFRDAELLRLWYLENLPFPEIRSRMKQQGYPASDRTLRNWHAAALKRLEQFGRTAQ